MSEKLLQVTHRRYNPLTGEWVLVAPGRIKRPWQGKVETVPGRSLPVYDPDCYLCPGNVRASNERNPKYLHTFVFDNDFSSLSHNTPNVVINQMDIMRAESEKGICRVICFSPRHNLTLAEMDPEEISGVVDVWKKEYSGLGSLEDINYIQIFENKGELMGCSNPHPHCQLWAESSVPVEPQKETLRLTSYIREHGSCLLCDYIDLEMKEGIRVVAANESFIAVVPYWATWPFETMVLPKRHLRDITGMTDEETRAFAGILKNLTARYDNLFNIPFPYSSGIHQSPTDGEEHPEWHFHMHFYPPLLRSATVRKFMVGYEMLANPQRDITAEDASARLRALPSVHYKHAK